MRPSALLPLLLALTAMPVCAHAADAPPPTVRAAFGNTLLTIDPDGRSRKIWLAPDGSWSGRSRRGLELAGTWKMDGKKLCLHQSKPGLPGHLCQLFPSGLKVGGPAVDDPSGRTGKLQLVKGRVTR